MKKVFVFIMLIAVVNLCVSCTQITQSKYSGEYPLSNQELDNEASLNLDNIINNVYEKDTAVEDETSGQNSDEITPVYIASEDEEIRGVWISYLEYDWALKGKSKEEFTNNITEIFNRCIQLELNTVIVQMRSHGDAYYNSEIYPTSKYASGTYNLDLDYDPLAIMVELAHSLNLQIHAWINPFRLTTSEALQSLPDTYKIKQWFENPNYMQCDQSSGLWYLNPNNDEVCSLISGGVAEIVSNYDIDAIHIDDYFYVLPPSTFGYDETTAKSATTKVVKSIYDTIKNIKSDVLFGISPAGGYTDTPRSDQTQYTDIVLWCSTTGYLDYIVPQIYWEFDHSTAPFLPTMQKWEALLQNSPVTLHIGLASYKFANDTILNQQIKAVNASTTSKGYVHFRYDNIK